ncbi:MAG: histidine kinase [Gammaproteobacteria bacterium]
MRMWVRASRKWPYFHATVLTAAVVIAVVASVSGIIATSPASKVTGSDPPAEPGLLLASTDALIGVLQSIPQSQDEFNLAVQALTGIIDRQLRAVHMSVIADTSQNGEQNTSRRLLADWHNHIEPRLTALSGDPEGQDAEPDQSGSVTLYRGDARLRRDLRDFRAGLAGLHAASRTRAPTTVQALNSAYLVALIAILIAVIISRRASDIQSPVAASHGDRPPPTVKLQQKTGDTPPADEQSPAHVSASLELLQTVLAEFVDNPHARQPFLRLLRQIEGLINATCSAIFIAGNADGHWLALACTDSGQCERFARLLRDQQSVLRERKRELVQIHDPTTANARLMVLHLHHDDTIGESLLLLQLASSSRLSATELGFLKTQSANLAGIIHSTQRARQNQRLALCDERAAIARELHDSLAQSLSYLKIQASRLESLLHLDSPEQALDCKDADAVLQELRAHLNLAYRQLRELITTFRLTMAGRSLAQALADSVEEFESRSSIVFSLDNRIAADLLSVDEEMQVLQIVRECLCNIVRHAHAGCATVVACSDSAGNVTITVDDDGVGLSAPIASEQHHGLVIMQQRAHSLGGEMHVSANPGGGTRVQVIFAARGAGSGRKPQPTPLARARPLAEKAR